MPWLIPAALLYALLGSALLLLGAFRPRLGTLLTLALLLALAGAAARWRRPLLAGWRTCPGWERACWGLALLCSLVALGLRPALTLTDRAWRVEEALREGDPLDPWGHPWCSKDDVSPWGPVEVRYSAGPDGVDQQGQGDDVTGEDSGLLNSLAVLMLVQAQIFLLGLGLPVVLLGLARLVAIARLPRVASLQLEVARAAALSLPGAILLALLGSGLLRRAAELAGPSVLVPPRVAALGSLALGSFVIALVWRLSRPLAGARRSLEPPPEVPATPDAPGGAE